MAPKLVFVFLVYLHLRSALSMPVMLDIKSVQSSDNVADVELTNIIVVFHPDTILSRGEDSDQVKSLDSVNYDHTFDANSVNRPKRELINGNHSCAQGMKWYWNMCVTLEKYNKLKENDVYEITALPEDEGVTPRSRTTLLPEPTSQPGSTPHSLTTSHPKPTPRPQTTPRPGLAPHSPTSPWPGLPPHFLTTPPSELTTSCPELTPQSLMTPRPELLPHSLANRSSKQDHISSSLMHLVAIILVQYQIWCHHHTTF